MIPPPPFGWTIAEVLALKGGQTFGVSPGARIADAIAVMSSRAIGTVLVQDRRGHYLGQVSERDVVRGLAEQPRLLEAPAWTCMVRYAPIGRLEEPVLRAFEAMHRRHARHLPIVEGDRKAVGVVSVGDVLGLLTDARPAGTPHSVSFRQVLERQSQKMIQIDPRHPVRQAVARMNLDRVGAVLVATGGRLLGLLTERSIAMKLAEFGDALLDLPAQRVMLREFPSASPDDDIHAAIRELVRAHARHLPVLEDDRIRGIVGIGDIVAGMVARLPAISAFARAAS